MLFVLCAHTASEERKGIIHEAESDVCQCDKGGFNPGDLRVQYFSNPMVSEHFPEAGGPDLQYAAQMDTGDYNDGSLCADSKGFQYAALF